jgi:hypothetical protein
MTEHRWQSEKIRDTRGWVRTVFGIQSLFGVALVALSLLSYFGHPFE